MNENVRIYIEGIVSEGEEGSITTNAIGQYRQLEGVHILSYEDTGDLKDENSDNTIKISPRLVEMIKNGINSTHMVFDIDQSTQSLYETPYGSICFLIQTNKINVEEMVNEIILHLEYSLYHDNSHISDNRIRIVVKELNTVNI
jgi:uncharacterized beta-barrel protein YwiB (DUF1934 family)